MIDSKLFKKKRARVLWLWLGAGLSLSGIAHSGVPDGTRGVPDGFLPTKSAGVAMETSGVIEETILRFDEIGITDLGESADFECFLGERPLKLKAIGRLKLGKETFDLDGVCISEDKKRVEYKVENFSFIAVIKRSRRGKVFNGNIEIDGKSYRVLLNRHVQ